MTNEHKPVIKAGRRILLGLVLTLVAGMIVLVAAYSYVMTPSVQKRILASIRDPLAKAGVALDVDHIRIDLFAGVNFVDLQLKINRPPQVVADLTISKIRLSYSFWGLLSHRLELRDARVEGLKGHVDLRLEPSEQAKNQPPPDLQMILGLLRDPPVEVFIPQMTLKDTALQIKFASGPTSLQADVERGEVDLAVKIVAGQLEIKADTALGAGLRFKNIVQDGTKTDFLAIDKFLLLSNLHIEAKTLRDAIDWTLQFSSSSLAFDSLQFNTLAEKNSATISLAHGRMGGEGVVKRSGSLGSGAQFADLLKGLKLSSKTQISIAGFKLASDIQDVSLGKLALSQKSDVTFGEQLFEGHHDLALNHKFSLENLGIYNNLKTSGSKTALFLLPKIAWGIEGGLRDGSGSFSGKADVSELTVDGFKGPLSLTTSGGLDLNLVSGSWSGRAESQLNGDSFISWTGEGHDAAGVLNSENKLKLETHAAWSKIVSALASLEVLGWPNLDVTIAANVKHRKPWSEFKEEDLKDVVGGLGVKVLSQAKSDYAKSDKTLLRTLDLDSKIEILPKSKDGKETTGNGNIALVLGGLKNPNLKQEARLRYAVAGDFSVGKRIEAHAADQIFINDVKFASSDIKLTDANAVATLSQRLESSVSPKEISAIQLVKDIPNLGHLKVMGNHEIHYLHGKRSLPEALKDQTSPPKIKVKVDEDVSQSLGGLEGTSTAGPIVKLLAPLRLKATVNTSGNNIDGTVSYQAKDLASGVIRAKGVDGEVSFGVGLASQSKSGEQISLPAGFVHLNTRVQGVEISKSNADGQPTADILGSLSGLYLKLKARSFEQTKVAIDDMDAGAQDDLIKATGKGEFNLIGAGQFDGLVSSSPKPSGSLVKGSGAMRMPFKVKKYDERRVAVLAEPKFTEFSVKYGDIEISGIDGSMRVSEDLRIDKDGKVGFLYLRNQAPFARVDYENIEPFVSDARQIRIQKLAWRHVQIGPVEQSFDISQNLILLNELRMNALSGNAVGRAYLDLHPARLRLGFLGRFSGFKPELLKAPENRVPEADWAELGGRAAINFDVRKRLASGRMDLTSIGKRQLLSLMDALDPENKDDKISLLRRALQVAYPRRVDMSMDQGLMDMEVGVGGALTQDFKIRSLPLSGFINSIGGEALQKIDDLFD